MIVLRVIVLGQNKSVADPGLQVVGRICEKSKFHAKKFNFPILGGGVGELPFWICHCKLGLRLD